MRSLALLGRSLVLASLAPQVLAAPNGVTVVAPSGGEYADIQPAIDAAADGEIVLVRAGSYGPFTVSSKSVHVIADAGASVTVVGPVAIELLPAGKTATIQGLSIAQQAFSADGGLRIDACDGHVRVIATDVTPAPPTLGSTNPPAAVTVTGCADVAMNGVTATGTIGQAFGSLFSSAPAPGLTVSASTLSIHDSTLVGGAGASGQTGVPSGNTPGFAGAEGLRVNDASTVLVVGGACRGGEGGPGVSGGTCIDPLSHPTSGGPGGPGARLLGVVDVRAYAGALVGGMGGPGGSAPGCTRPPGANGAASTGGSVATIAGAARRLARVEPARVGGNLLLRFEGQPGDAVFLALAVGSTHVAEPALNGDLLVLPPFRRFNVGTIPGSGVLDVMLPVGALPGGVEGARHSVQGIFRDVSNVLWASGASAAIRLDASF